MNTLKISLIGILLAACANSAAAQVFVVQTADAKFMDGSTVVALIDRGTEFYALEEKDGWLRAVEPKSQMPAWIAKSKAKLKALTKAEFANEARLWDQVTQVERYVNAASATTVQLKEALAIASGLREFWGDKHPHAAVGLDYAGLVAANAGAMAQADTLLNEALELHLNLYGKKAPETAQVYVDLASFSIDRHQLKPAIDYARKAWEINRDALGGDHPDAISTTLPLAVAMETIQEYEDALRIYRTAHRVFLNSYGERHLQTQKTHAKIAQQLVSLGRKNEAIPIYKSVVALLEQHHPGQKRYIALQRLRLASARLDADDPVSLQEFRESVVETERKFPDLAEYIRGQQKIILSRLLKAGDITTAFSMVDARLRQLRQSLRKELWGMTAEQQREHLAVEDSYTFYSSISLAADFAVRPDVVEMSGEWLMNGKGLVQEAQSIQGGATLNLDKREAWANEPWVTLPDLRDTLTDDEVFVDILLYLDFDFDKNAVPSSTGERYAAWITQKQGDVRFLDLGPAEPIQKTIADLRTALAASHAQIKKLRDEAAYEALRPILLAASRLIWHPILKVCGKRTKIVLSPDHSTWLLPWPALLNKDGTTFAVETHQIQLELSGRDFVKSDLEGSNQRAVIFADPVFDATVIEPQRAENRSIDNAVFGVNDSLKISKVGRLTFSAPEAALIAPAISRLTGDKPQTLMQGDALESAFKQLKSPSVLVISTHGFFLDGDQTQSSVADETRSVSSISSTANLLINPLLKCGLMLAGANQHLSIDSLENDGVLTGLEIADTDLSGTRLAVLSACKTGLGELEATGGVVGLRRAFHVAGVQSVMSSLWEIPDRDTMILIQGFFESLSDSRDVRASLQATQQRHVKTRRKRFGVAHPFYWAAFVLTGDTEF